jgi:tetratricopeptide (TPR) repeat protein
LKTYYKIILSLFCAAFIAQSCSRKKDTFINRNFHALGTKYNILYNGELALERGKLAVNDEFTENFWELLPIERMEVKEDIFLPGQSKNADFDRAQEKAIKAIQKHGMNIDGKEKNYQIDEAYLLLGKARYFDQRFVPALAALNNILNKYPTSDKINQVKIWREKTNMRLDNNEVAIKKIKRLLDEEELNDQDLADATATLAQAYVNLKHKDSALAQLEIAAEYTKNKSEKARYHFIRGQLYNEFKEKDSANMEFDAIIDMHRQVPRSFYINAHIEKSNNFDKTNGDLLEFQEYLTDLEENRENRPFLDKIYYRIAEFHRSNASDSLSEAYYNKSLRKTTSDKYLKSLNYETLGNMYFDRNVYKTAGAYYDSTMTAMVKNTKPYRVIKKKRENLDDVIYYEGIAQTNDSILNMISLPKEEQLAIYSAYAEQLKIKTLEEEKLKVEQAEKKKNTVTTAAKRNSLSPYKTESKSVRSPRATPGGIGNKSDANSRFYFYNSTTVAYGKNEFLKTWGDRQLQDNWRLSDQRANIKSTDDKQTVTTTKSEDKRFDPQTYLATLPSTQVEVDSIFKERNFAYYQLGIIYKEKFKEYGLAKSKLETLLENNPEDRLVLPSKYNLYRIYVELGLNRKADAMKGDIVANYPESRYAEILLNPQSELAKDENSPEYIYTNLYKQFENQDYAEVIAIAEAQIKRLEGDDFVPKFEILKASAKGRLYGFEAYKEGINYIALTYPNTEEGKKAQDILKDAIPALAKNEFIEDDKAQNFNVIYQFDKNSGEDIDAFVKTLNEEIEEKIKYFNLTTSKDIYDEKTIFVVVHGLKSIQGAGGFAQLLQTDDKDQRGRVIPPKINKEYFAISSPNYAIIQRHKNINAYLKLQ